MKHTCEAFVVPMSKRAADDLSTPVRWVASTPGVMSDGMSLELDAWDLSRYEKLGPVLWAHDLQGDRLPIGKGKAFLTDRALMIDCTYDMGDLFAMECRRKALLGMIGGSVQWNPVKTDAGRMVNQLVEFSNVPVGVDPNSGVERAAARSRALKAAVIAPPGAVDYILAEVQQAIRGPIQREIDRLGRQIYEGSIARNSDRLLASLRRLR